MTALGEGRTEALVYHVFTRTSSDPSTAAVEAVVLFVIMLGLTMLQLRVLERRVFYGE